MKKHSRWVYYLVLVGVIAWGLISPAGIRGAWANNDWSTRFVTAYFVDPSRYAQLPPAPRTHAHADIFLIKQALQRGDSDAALRYISPLLEGRDPVLLSIYAQILYQQEKYLPAFAVWEELGDEASLWRAAGEMREIGREDLRLAAAKSLFTIDPDLHAGFYAGTLREAKEDSQAIAVLNNVLVDFPQSEQRQQWQKMLSDAYSARGEYYLNQKQWDQAEEFLNLAIQAREENWIAWKYLGWVHYYRDGDVEKAIANFLKVIELVPESGEGYRDIVDIHVREKNIPEALTWLKKGMALFPDKEGFFMTYANLLRDSGEFEKALDAYRVVIERFPPNGWFFYEMAWAYLRNDQPDEALAAAQQAVTLNDQTAAFHSLEGQILVKLGDFEGAREAYRRTLALDPENGWAKAALQELEGAN